MYDWNIVTYSRKQTCIDTITTTNNNEDEEEDILLQKGKKYYTKKYKYSKIL